jgi:hypothetical protein
MYCEFQQPINLIMKAMHLCGILYRTNAQHYQLFKFNMFLADCPLSQKIVKFLALHAIR